MAHAVHLEVVGSAASDALVREPLEDLLQRGLSHPVLLDSRLSFVLLN